MKASRTAKRVLVDIDSTGYATSKRDWTEVLLALLTARLVAGRDACNIALTSTDETRSVSKNDVLG